MATEQPQHPPLHGYCRSATLHRHWNKLASAGRKTAGGVWRTDPCSSLHLRRYCFCKACSGNAIIFWWQHSLQLQKSASSEITIVSGFLGVSPGPQGSSDPCRCSLAVCQPLRDVAGYEVQSHSLSGAHYLDVWGFSIIALYYQLVMNHLDLCCSPINQERLGLLL